MLFSTLQQMAPMVASRTCLILTLLFFTLLASSLNSASPTSACQFTFLDGKKLYNYTLSSPIPNFPHGILSEDGCTLSLSLSMNSDLAVPLFRRFLWSFILLILIIYIYFVLIWLSLATIPWFKFLETFIMGLFNWCYYGNVCSEVSARLLEFSCLEEPGTNELEKEFTLFKCDWLVCKQLMCQLCAPDRKFSYLLSLFLCL